MRRMVIVVMCLACVGVMAIAEDMEEPVVVEEPIEEVKKEKVKKPKKEKVKKEKKVKPEKAEKAKKPKPVLEEMTIKGVISAAEKKKGEKTYTYYTLTDGEGNKMVLPKPRKPKKDDEDAKLIKLADYVDSAVIVTAKCMKMTRKGKEMTFLKQLISVEKQGDAEEIEVFPEEKAEEAAE